MLKTLDLYDLTHSLAGDYLSGFEYPWQALKGIKDLLLSLGAQLGEDYTEIAPTVWVHNTAKVAPTAYLGAPLHHRCEYRGAALCLCPGFCPGRRKLRGRKLRGTEKRHPFR